jgi:hypothetical protein
MASAERDRVFAWARPGSAFMRPVHAGERELNFSSHYLWPALAVLPLLPSFYAALHGRHLRMGSAAWLALVVVGGVFLAAALLLFLYRESLVVDRERLTFTHRRGCWPNPATRHGSLHEFQAVALDLLPARRKSGPVWVASLQFMAPDRRIAVANFSDGGKAHSYVDGLARTLDLPVLDRSGEEERTIGLSRIGAPIAVRADLASRRIDAPPNPRIRITGDAPHRLITLPAMGVNIAIVFLALLPALLVWLALNPPQAFDAAAAAAHAAHRHLRPQLVIEPWQWTATLYTLAGLSAAFLVLLSAARWDIRERGDSIVATSRAFGVQLSRRKFRKDEIVAIELQPAPVGRTVLYDLQIRARRKLLTIATTLGGDSARWLEQALMSMLGAR